MTDDSPEDGAERLLAAGWGVLEKRDLEGARQSFEAALLTGKHIADEAEAYEGLGWVAWWANDADVLFPARERAYALYRQQGDPVAAARQAVWLGCDHHDFRGEHAVANGWCATSTGPRSGASACGRPPKPRARCSPTACAGRTPNGLGGLSR